MTDDVADRAQQALSDEGYAHVHGVMPPYPRALVRELVDALRAARTENEQLRKLAKVVEYFIAERAEVITAIKNCPSDNIPDYWRWQGHAAARRVLLEQLPPDIAERIAKKAGITDDR